MASTPEEMAQSMLDNLPAKTGRALPDWMALLTREGLTSHKEMMAFLKGEHGVTHGYANLITQLTRRAAEGGAPTDPDLVSAQYSGPKEALRPVYDRLVTAVQGFGDDVEIAPKKAYVSLRRKKQFGLIQPSTRTRVDIGINLKGEAAGPRLEKSGSFNSMVSHRVRISGPDEVDEEVIGWLRDAYDRAG